MAIFKRNRNQNKKPEIVPAPAAAPVESSAEAQGEGFTPVLSFSDSPAKQEPRKMPRPDDLTGEVDNIAGIFGASQSTASASRASEQVSEKMSEVQSRWFTRRRKAIEQARSAAADAAEVSGEAPPVESMQSVPAEMRTRAARLGHQKPENPVSLAFADLSDRTDLDPFEVEDATEIYGIKYPPGFDTSLVDYSGRAIDFSDFSRVERLRWRHIEKATDISGVVFPASFDVGNASFFGRSLRSCDFSAVYALRWKHLQPAGDIIAIKYPATFDIDEAQFASRNISGSDFSLVTKLRWAHIAEAEDIRGIKYPAAFEPSETQFEGRDISGSDFSLVSRLRWEHISEAANLEGIIYPKDFDFDNADFRGMDISESDFSRALSFCFTTIEGASDIRSLKYPDCFDSSLARFAGKDISGSNFSRVSSLRFAHIKDASDITRLVYPPQFDIDEADFTDRDIDYSDFSLLPGFNWRSVRLAGSREGLVMPASFVVPKNTDEDVQGAMLIMLLKLYKREFRGEMDVERFYNDISALYPGIEDTKAAELIDAATKKLEQPDGRRIIELTAREAHAGDKLFMIKLSFKLLYPRHKAEVTEKLLREHFYGIFRKHERERFEHRLADLRKGKYLSAGELSAIGYQPELEQKAKRSVAVTERETDIAEAAQTEIGTASSADDAHTAETAAVTPYVPAADAAPTDGKEAGIPAEKTDDKKTAEGMSAEDAADMLASGKAPVSYEVPEGSKVFTFGHVQMDSVPVSTEPFELPPEIDETPATPATETAAAPAPAAPAPAEPVQSAPAAASETASAPQPLVPADFDASKYTPKPVDLNKLRQKRAGNASKLAGAPQKRDRLSDEEKAIRTGVMGMLLYIHQNISEENLSNADLFAEFMKIYPGAVPKEAAAMAQFASNTLSGTNAETRAKLFMFASRAPGAVKRKLLDFSYEEYVYKLSETADEEIFRDFLRAICDTLFEDSPEYEYSSYLRSRDILKDPPLKREASYRRISFENNLGKVNLYANEKYPFERTLEQVGFAHFGFDAIKSSLLIEVSDSRYYEDLENLVYREREPSLLHFIVIDTSMGFLYLEKRCVDKWQIDEREVWAAAERNMMDISIRPKYSFASSEFSSFRYIQHNLASYLLNMPELLRELSCGQDLILSLPCREIAYIDYYDFSSIKKMLEFSSRYNCTLIINGEEFEHPFSNDIFIYHTADGSLERVNDETYILLGDSVSRRQVLSSVLPLNIDFNAEKLCLPQTTDDVEQVTDEQCVVQEAVLTLLRLYSEMNGDKDYTIPLNVFMAVVDEDFIPFDSIYPPVRGREQPDPMDHLPEVARMAAKGGKTLCWLLIQALQYLCGDIKYETPTSAHIRETVIEQIYGDNANAVWLNCATASDFTKRLEAVKRFFEKPVDNHRLMILDSQVEVAMHSLTMIFHQFSRRYALGQVRRHMLKAVPELSFTYEMNQSAWLPAPGEDVDVDAQSLGMIFRGFDRATQERMLSTFADAIGDRDLSEGGWPLLYFIKFVKYAYLDPVEMVERYFISRSRLIPSHTVLKQLYYKDLNNEFVKHSRQSGKMESAIYEDAFDERIVSKRLGDSVEHFDNMLGLGDMPELDDAQLELPTGREQLSVNQKPDMQLTPIEPGYLEKKLSFVLEELNQQVGNSLRDAAHYVTKVFHVPEVMFKANDDLECELHYGIIRSRDQITVLRSFAWTLAGLVYESGRDMRDVTEGDINRAIDAVTNSNMLNYKPDTKYFRTLCSMPLDEGMYIPCQQEYVFFAQELMPEVRLASLFTLQEELAQLAPAMKLTYDILREQKRGDIMPPKGVLFDALCAWSAFCFASVTAFEVSKGPQMYNYSQIDR